MSARELFPGPCSNFYFESEIWRIAPANSPSNPSLSLLIEEAPLGKGRRVDWSRAFELGTPSGVWNKQTCISEEYFCGIAPKKGQMEPPPGTRLGTCCEKMFGLPFEVPGRSKGMYELVHQQYHLSNHWPHVPPSPSLSPLQPSSTSESPACGCCHRCL